MTEIQKTHLATSDPISLNKGFALFPGIGTVRAGISSKETLGTLVDTQDTMLYWRVIVKFDYTFFMGVCGPAYAIVMDAVGQTSDGQVTLTISDDKLQAGFLAGINFQIGLTINLLQYTPHTVWKHWHPSLQFKWDQVASANASIKLDLLDLIRTVIIMALEENGKKDTAVQKVSKFVPALLGSWGIFDAKNDQFVKNKGKMSAYPTFNIPIDISSMVPALKALNEPLKAFFSHIGTGPQIGLQIPVTVELDKIKLDATEYTGLSFTDKQITGKTASDDPAAPRELSFTLKHTPGFDLTLGWYFNLQLCKLFNIGGSVSFPILSMLGISVKTGPFSNDLKNDIGSTTIASCVDGNLEGARLVEVIFDEPLAVAS